MKQKIKLDSERMDGFGPYIIDEFQVNYLFGLNDLCEKYVDKEFEILELGCNNGVSSELFSFFCKNVICVDVNKTEKMNKVLLQNNNIIFHHKTFESFYLDDVDRKYDLIYIDGNHDYDSVEKDISLFKTKVKKGGYLTGHDYNSDTPSVERAVKHHFPLEEIKIFSDSSWLIQIK